VNGPEDYCREIESYLCRKNDGHLIRIVGPAFEQVTSWAQEGIPLSVALTGVDRYFERYYKKGARRRPVRIEYCDADVRDAFDDWRRAVGVARRADDSADASAGSRRQSLASHIERALAKLTSLRASTQNSASLADQLESIVRELDRMVPEARRARGDARDRLLVELDRLDCLLIEAASAAVAQPERARLVAEAARELEPFRGRMLPDARKTAEAAAYARLVRDRYGLPTLHHD
jgi:hypothetical protein